MTDICALIKEHFHFLETDYGCKLDSSDSQTWWTGVVYRNSTTGIKVVWEAKCQFLFVEFYKLVDGKMVGNPSPLTPESEITSFELQDTLPESERMKSPYEYGLDSPYSDPECGLSNYVQDIALRLEKYGKDVLRGDFCILPTVAKLIIARAFPSI